jgi:hypothetical protein
MAPNVDQTRWATWQRRISKQQGSGLSIVEFCRRERISQGSFHAWKRKPGRRDTAGPGPQRGSAAKRQRIGAEEGPSVKLAVSPAAGFVQIPLAATGGREWVEPVLRDGTLVRAPAHQTTALTTILRVLCSEDPADRPVAKETHHALRFLDDADLRSCSPLGHAEEFRRAVCLGGAFLRQGCFLGRLFRLRQSCSRSLQGPVQGSRWLGRLGQTPGTGLLPTARKQPR